MQPGTIGLGRMGASLTRRVTTDDHQCVVYDANRAAVDKIAGRADRHALIATAGCRYNLNPDQVQA